VSIIIALALVIVGLRVGFEATLVTIAKLSLKTSLLQDPWQGVAVKVVLFNHVRAWQ